jgi:hypothetical protein
VDVESFPSGNVLKMLLGSINKNFDYNDQDIAMELEPHDNVAAQRQSLMSDVSYGRPRSAMVQSLDWVPFPPSLRPMRREDYWVRYKSPA